MNQVTLAKRKHRKLKPGEYLFQGQIRQRVPHEASGDKVTRDSHAAECDINNIVQRYTETGGVIQHVNRQEPQYGEAPEGDFTAHAFVNAELASMEEEGRFEGLGEPEEDPVTDSEPSEDEKPLQEDPSQDLPGNVDLGATEA